MRNEWAHSVFVRGFGLTLLKAGPIPLPAVVGVWCCNNWPLEKKEMRRKALLKESQFILMELHNVPIFEVIQWNVPGSCSVMLAINEQETFKCPVEHFFQWC